MEWRLLAALPEVDRARVLDAARPRHFARGEVIFHEGDPGESLHLIRSGRVAVRLATEHGETAILSVVGAGEAFGELALLRRSRQRTASVLALEPTETLMLTRGAFEQLRSRHPSAERLLVGLLADRVDELSQRLLEALFAGVDRRVAMRLIGLLEVYGNGSAGDVVIPLTQDDLAGLTGASRPTVNQVLQRLAAQGVIGLHRGRIEVHDAKALRHRAGL